jgi:hypothetical protein
VKVDDHHLNSSAVLPCAFVLCVTQLAFWPLPFSRDVGCVDF